MPRWIRLLAVEECPPGTARECIAEDRIVALFNIDGEFFALDGICPHQGGPLGQGKLTGCLVTCPWHGWQFDVTTGVHQTSATLQHPGFDIQVEAGIVYVDLDCPPKFEFSGSLSICPTAASLSPRSLVKPRHIAAAILTVFPASAGWFKRLF